MKKQCVAVAGLALLAFAAPANAQGMGNIVPLHSFADIPPLPKTVAEVQSRTSTDDKDKEAAPLRQRIDGWGKAMAASVQATTPGNYAAYMGMAGRGGTMSPAAGNALGMLAQTVGKMSAELAESLHQYSPQEAALEDAYEQKVKTASDKYQTCMRHGTVRSCHGVYVSAEAAALAAGDEFLHAVDGPFTAFKTRMSQIAAEGESTITQTSRAFGGNPPPLARPQIQAMRQQELAALIAVVNAEQSIIDRVDRKPLVEMASPDRG